MTVVDHRASKPADPAQNRGAGLRILRTAGLLSVFWLLLSGHFTPLFLTFGVISVALISWLCHRAALPSDSGSAIRFALRLPGYLPWLAKEIFVSSIAVVRSVWSPRSRLSPGVELLPAHGLSVLSQVLYANSITLTPGTLSLRVDDHGVEVHGLRSDYLEDLRQGPMLSKVRRLEAVK